MRRVASVDSAIRQHSSIKDMMDTPFHPLSLDPSINSQMTLLLKNCVLLHQ
jgi:hypothetical protein